MSEVMSAPEGMASDLDGLALVPMSLEAQWKLSQAGTEMRVATSSLRGKVDAKGIRKRLFAPFMARNLMAVDSRSPRVLALCSTLHFVSGFVTTDAQTLSQVPMQRQPKRICPVYYDRMPNLEELEYADAIELQMITSLSARPTRDTPLGAPIWPIDCTDIQKLKKKLESLRELSHHQIPVGVAIPKGTANVDVLLLAKAEADFVTLVDRASFGHAKSPQGFEVSDLWMAVHARKAAVAGGQPDMPILLDTVIRNGYDLVKLAALGVSGVVLDRFLMPTLDVIEAEEKPSQDRFLAEVTGQIDGGIVVRELGKVVRRLSQIQREACDALTLCGYRSIEEVQAKMLIATTEKAHRLTGIPMI